MEQDNRWKQRFINYEKALQQLTVGIETYGQSPTDIEKEGIIQRFEFTHELAWKVMKDYLLNEGFQDVMGSKSATRESFANGLIENGQEWMNMIESRNKTVHTYHANILSEEYTKVVSIYHALFLAFYGKMKARL